MEHQETAGSCRSGGPRVVVHEGISTERISMLPSALARLYAGFRETQREGQGRLSSDDASGSGDLLGLGPLADRRQPFSVPGNPDDRRCEPHGAAHGLRVVRGLFLPGSRCPSAGGPWADRITGSWHGRRDRRDRRTHRDGRPLPAGVDLPVGLQCACAAGPCGRHRDSGASYAGSIPQRLEARVGRAQRKRAHRVPDLRARLRTAGHQADHGPHRPPDHSLGAGR